VGDMPDLLSHPLTYIRWRRGWTMTDVAEIVARGLNMAARREKVWRWEHGRAVPEIAAQLALAAELGIAPDQVADRPWPAWLLLVDDLALDQPWSSAGAVQTLTANLDAALDRRGFLLLSGQAACALAGGWAAVPVEKAGRAAAGGVADAEVATWIESRLSSLWHLDDLIGGDYCLELAVSDLRLVTRLLAHGRYRGRVEQRLYKAAAELCRFAGWTAFDAGRHAAAERYWHAGLRSAAQAGDLDTGAYILSQMALQRTYAGDGHSAVSLLQVARDRVGSAVPRSVHAMLDAWAVRAHAIAGESRQAARALVRADEHWEQRRPEDDPPWIYWMQRPSLTIEVGMAFVVLDQAATAERLLVEGMEQGTAGYGRDRVLALAALSTARLAQGELDGALEAGRQAAEAAAEVDSTRVVDQLRAVATHLPAESAAQEFREFLRALDAPGA
jgi:transcriptional regulator with XRE-family HTH domain